MQVDVLAEPARVVISQGLPADPAGHKSADLGRQGQDIGRPRRVGGGEKMGRMGWGRGIQKGVGEEKTANEKWVKGGHGICMKGGEGRVGAQAVEGKGGKARES
jgi:hypothetical protein